MFTTYEYGLSYRTISKSITITSTIRPIKNSAMCQTANKSYQVKVYEKYICEQLREALIERFRFCMNVAPFLEIECRKYHQTTPTDLRSLFNLTMHLELISFGAKNHCMLFVLCYLC